MFDFTKFMKDDDCICYEKIGDTFHRIGADENNNVTDKLTQDDVSKVVFENNISFVSLFTEDEMLQVLSQNTRPRD